MAILLPTTKTTSVQGQTDEFAVTSSEYGKAIPYVIGTDRLSGNVIWADNIREEKTTDVQRSGGKGSPKQETTTVTYRYYVDLAVMFAEGEVQALRRIWADGKIIYDATGVSIEEIDGLNFTLYRGTETQMPDPTIEANVGENMTPAFRGLAYIVFNDFPLSNFGNRIPALTAEFAFGGQGGEVTAYEIDYLDLTGNGSSTSNDLKNTVVFGKDGRFYIEGNRSGADDIRSVILGQGTMSDLIDEDVDEVFGNPLDNITEVLTDGTIIGAVFEGNSSTPGGRLSIGFTEYDLDTVMSDKRCAAIPDNENYIVIGGVSSAVHDGRTVVVNRSLLNSEDNGNALAQSVQLARTGVQDSGMTISGASGQVYDFFVNSAGQVEVRLCTPTSITTIAQVDPEDLYADETAWGSDGVWGCYDPVQDRLILSKAGTVYDSILFQVEPNGTVTALRNDLPFGPRANFDLCANGANLVAGNTLVWCDTDGSVIRWLLSDNTIDPNFDGQTPGLLENSYTFTVAWDEANSTLWTNEGINSGNVDEVRGYVFSTGDGEDINPQVVLSEICQRVGLAADDIDVTDVPTAGLGVKSYIAGERASAATLLEPFVNTLQIDTYESDGKLKFRKRGLASSVATISEDDFIPTSENEGQAYIRPRVQETDLPRRVEVAYADVANQYQDGLQADERSTNAVSSTGLQTIEYPGAMTAQGAVNAAQTLLYEYWSEQERIGSRLPWKYVHLDPTDVVTFNLDTGEAFNVRLRKADTGADLTMDFDAVIEADEVYTANATGDSGSGNLVTTPANVGDSSTFLFDTPLLRDGDAASAGQTNTYWSGSGAPTWNGVVLYRKEGDTIIQDVGKQLQDIPFGTVSTSPGDATQFFTFDEDGSMVVNITRGEDLFESVTELDVLNGANVLLIVKDNGEVEFLQFQNIEVDAGNSQLITLSKLLRGRRGTDTMANNIQVGDAVYLMAGSTYVNAFKRDLATLNAATTYRGVTVGQFYEDAEDQSFTDTGRDLMPYAPVKIEVTQPGGADTDLTFTWVRRTRIGGEDDLNDGTTDVPLSEDSEDYDLVIYTDDTYSTELRVINVSSETADYTAAQITADTPGSTIYYRVYQRSAQVGRGFASDQSTPRNL